jgi:hypothetical protein
MRVSDIGRGCRSIRSEHYRNPGRIERRARRQSESNLCRVTIVATADISRLEFRAASTRREAFGARAESGFAARMRSRRRSIADCARTAVARRSSMCRQCLGTKCKYDQCVLNGFHSDRDGCGWVYELWRGPRRSCSGATSFRAERTHWPRQYSHQRRFCRLCGYHVCHQDMNLCPISKPNDMAVLFFVPFPLTKNTVLLRIWRARAQLFWNSAAILKGCRALWFKVHERMHLRSGGGLRHDFSQQPHSYAERTTASCCE